MVWNESIGKGTADDNTDGLEDAECRQKKATILWQEFQSDGGVDWDVTSHTEACEGYEDKEHIVGIWDAEA